MAQPAPAAIGPFHSLLLMAVGILAACTLAERWSCDQDPEAPPSSAPLLPDGAGRVQRAGNDQPPPSPEPGHGGPEWVQAQLEAAAKDAMRSRPNWLANLAEASDALRSGAVPASALPNATLALDHALVAAWQAYEEFLSVPCGVMLESMWEEVYQESVVAAIGLSEADLDPAIDHACSLLSCAAWDATFAGVVAAVMAGMEPVGTGPPPPLRPWDVIGAAAARVQLVGDAPLSAADFKALRKRLKFQGSAPAGSPAEAVSSDAAMDAYNLTSDAAIRTALRGIMQGVVLSRPLLPGAAVYAAGPGAAWRNVVDEMVPPVAAVVLPLQAALALMRAGVQPRCHTAAYLTAKRINVASDISRVKQPLWAHNESTWPAELRERCSFGGAPAGEIPLLAAPLFAVLEAVRPHA
jgi:hypothetical protein